ncbi:uncharacterized protein LOC133836800 [Drosophila sulfurigaster albostrigata]|uniref:uncharacterized protein LOC133836800 n=1 Tax=Drosophila sulfurigaster albostrigata TaxID=89887 RepID=UPI002D21B799|nr:uncharacterized protein LOC133836800 [Drosophila sulfurigaster albostrigata]
MNKAFLSGLQNLEVFEFNGGFKDENVHLYIDKQMFQGLPKLSKIILINGIITIENDHFQNLTNLKFLSFTTTLEFGYKILSSETLRNNLEHLVITPPYYFQTDDVKQYLATYKKLQIIETLKDYHYQFFNDNITAFICVQKERTCQFISGINNVTCPHFCDCILDRLEMRFDISCHHYYVKIPVLPIPIIGNTTLKFNNNNITIEKLQEFLQLEFRLFANTKTEPNCCCYKRRKRKRSK